MIAPLTLARRGLPQPLVSANLGVELSRDRGSRRRFTRGWVIWHMLEHDLHHDSEIALILRANCLPTIHLYERN